MKIVFLGTPDFAVPSLKAILSSHHEILVVITQEDKGRDRGKKIACSPVKTFAKENGLQVLQYSSIRKQGVDDLKHLNPDIMVTCAYGQILSQEIIDIPTHGIINIHGSLLPKFRGAAPIQRAILNGETVTGITLMQTERGIDTGDMLLKGEIPITDEDTSQTLFDKLSILGSELILKGLDQIEKGEAVFEKQNADEATFAPMITKEEGKIDFSKTSREVFNHVRGMNPSPIAFVCYGENRIKVYSGEISEMPAEFENATPGTILTADRTNGILIKTKDGAYKITTLQFPNSKVVDYKDFLNGRSLELGEIL